MDINKLDNTLFAIPEVDLTEHDKQLKLFCELSYLTNSVRVCDLRGILDQFSNEDLLSSFKLVQFSPEFDDYSDVPVAYVGEIIEPLVTEQELSYQLDRIWQQTASNQKKFF